MIRRWMVAALAAVLAAALVLPAAADDAESESGPLEVRAAPSLVDVGQATNIRATYEFEDGPGCQDRGRDDDDDGDGDGDDDDGAAETSTAGRPDDDDDDDGRGDGGRSESDDDAEGAGDGQGDGGQGSGGGQGDADDGDVDSDDDEGDVDSGDDGAGDGDVDSDDDDDEGDADSGDDDGDVDSDDDEGDVDSDDDEGDGDSDDDEGDADSDDDEGDADSDDDDGGFDSDDDDGGEAETGTAGARGADVTFVVDYGDGTAETMTVRGEDRRACKEKAFSRHAYATEGDYTVTVTATPEGGVPATASVIVQVGRGSNRLAGDDRFDTANRISQDEVGVDGDADAVLLARADQFADALASAGLASLRDAPVLLTGNAEVPQDVLDEIVRVLGDDGTVFLLGGESAIAPSVADTLTALGFEVVRISGADRIETALGIAEFLVASGAEFDEVVVASAGDFPDALAGAALAARTGAPILLTGGDVLDPRVRAFLTGLGTDVDVLVTGGPAAVSDAVVAELEGLGFEVERAHGANRFATAAALAEQRSGGADSVVLATGGNFPDALAGAAFAGASGAPVLLVGSELPEEARAFLVARAGQVRFVTTLGGESAVPESVVAEVEEVLGLR